MIKAEAIYKKQGKGDPKFDHMKLTIGDVVYEPIPIFYIRKSELPNLEALLMQAAKSEAAEMMRLAEQEQGVERYNRANAALLAKENFVRKW